MQSFILLLLSFLISFSSSERLCRKTSCFKVVKATRQSWVAGTKNGGHGTNYLITCVASTSSDKLKIRKLWIGDQSFEVKAVKDLNAYPQEKFSAGDTIYIQASRFITPNDTTVIRSEPAPQKYKGEALIGYKCGNKTRYTPVEKFEVLSRLNMP